MNKSAKCVLIILFIITMNIVTAQSATEKCLLQSYNNGLQCSNYCITNYGSYQPMCIQDGYDTYMGICACGSGWHRSYTS